ncbi:putative lysine methyltransferase, S-adenosyl-L-methionine-dependent methyltransferase [Plasmopara halstedii]
MHPDISLGDDKHIVTSEVALELPSHDSTGTDKVFTFVVPLLPRIEEDQDGDLIVRRRDLNQHRKIASYNHSRTQSPPHYNTKGTDTMFVLEARTRSTWDTAGTQLWRAAFLLVEYILNAPEIFKNQIVLELGCGIGFASIVASRLSQCVYATDLDHDALCLTQKNIERNVHGDIRPRCLDWSDSNLISIADETSAKQFDWSSTDQTELKHLTVIIASDIFYDDISTRFFLCALHRLMLQFHHAKAYVASERRFVFSVATMQVVSLGYDTFQRHICRHNPGTCHTYVSANQVRCRLCATEEVCMEGDNKLRFVVDLIPTNDLPQRLKYDRTSTLILWRIDAIIIQ